MLLLLLPQICAARSLSSLFSLSLSPSCTRTHTQSTCLQQLWFQFVGSCQVHATAIECGKNLKACSLVACSHEHDHTALQHVMHKVLRQETYSTQIGAPLPLPSAFSLSLWPLTFAYLPLYTSAACMYDSYWTYMLLHYCLLTCRLRPLAIA